MTIGVQKIAGDLSRRNATLREARDELTFSSFEARVEARGTISPYLDRALQGATLAPRPFWFVEATAAARSARPLVRTDSDVARDAKAPWTGLSFEGRVEAEWVFLAPLSIVPFKLTRLKTCVLPIVSDRLGLRLLTAEEAVRRGSPDLGRWMTKAQEIWEGRRKGSRAQDVPVQQYLNNHNNLVRQRPSARRVIYGAKGSHLRSVVVDPAALLKKVDTDLAVSAFVLDMNFYEIVVDTIGEAHYLAAILNTDYVNSAITASQTRGAFGTRDIHRRPFEALGIPLYDKDDEIHRRLGAISRRAHDVMADREPARTRARQLAPVAELVAEADELVRSVC